MRVLILGGTRFIGRRITADLMARGDDVAVVHRGDHEPAELAGCTHLHTARADFGDLADQVRALRPDAVIDTLAMTRDDACAVLPHLPDAQLVLLSSIDVYRAYELLLAGEGGEPVPITEEAPVREGRYIAPMNAPWAVAQFPFPADAGRAQIRAAAADVAVFRLDPDS